MKKSLSSCSGVEIVAPCSHCSRRVAIRSIFTLNFSISFTFLYYSDHNSLFFQCFFAILAELVREQHGHYSPESKEFLLFPRSHTPQHPSSEQPFALCHPTRR